MKCKKEGENYTNIKKKRIITRLMLVSHSFFMNPKEPTQVVSSKIAFLLLLFIDQYGIFILINFVHYDINFDWNIIILV